MVTGESIMRGNQQFSIAVHAMLMIAHFADTKITSEMVAQSAGCNAVIVRNLYQKLVAANLLTTRRGKGKTELAKPPEEITLWDIYAAVEGDSLAGIFKIHEHARGSCPVGGKVRALLQQHMNDTARAMQRELECVTLANLRSELLQGEQP